MKKRKTSKRKCWHCHWTGSIFELKDKKCPKCNEKMLEKIKQF